MMYRDHDFMDCFSTNKISEKHLALTRAIGQQAILAQNVGVGFARYLDEFMIPWVIAARYIGGVEKLRLLTASPFESWSAYWKLWQFNMELFSRGLTGSLKAIDQYGSMETKRAMDATLNSFFVGHDSEKQNEDILSFIDRHANISDMVTHVYPKAIQDIEPEYGFHFERENIKVAETDRFILYQILPIGSQVSINNSGKPVLIVPPYVLGANILGFLPRENRSYAHCFANQGIPTYIRVMKDIASNPAVQTLSGEDDARDTRYFCELLNAKHGKQVTLNGYCQGGYSALCNLLSGELDGLVDAFITCVSPMDGTRSKGLAHFLNSLPERFRDLIYGTKTLPNGNRVADGDLMGWVYKLKSIEMEVPVVTFLRDMGMFNRGDAKKIKISKTAAAINYWLQNERSDLPLAITQMSFDSYNIPLTDGGTLPVKLFGRKLNFQRLNEKNIPWLICYGENDDLVEKETALAPLDYIDAEVSPFPKGHVAIATSWSLPTSKCAPHKCFGEEKYRGPVRFHMDLDQDACVNGLRG
jgi:hypothetical protein